MRYVAPREGSRASVASICVGGRSATPLLRRTPRNSDACVSLTLRRTVLATANPELFHLDGPLQQVEVLASTVPTRPDPSPEAQCSSSTETSNRRSTPSWR